MNTVEYSRHTDDEIDLVELIKVLWANKNKIILSTLLSTVLAGIYAFTAKEQWTSKAEVVAPNLTDLGNYFSVQMEYHRILGKELDVEKLTNSLFEKFNLLSESLDKRREFLAQSEVYKKLSDDKSEQEKRIILEKLVSENIKITKPDPKKQQGVLNRKISFLAGTPEEAQRTLEQFISYTSQSSFRLEYDEFLVELNEKIIDLKFEANKIQQELSVNKDIQIKNLTHALDIANKAGIKEYSKVLDFDTNNPFIRVFVSDTKIPLSESKLSDDTYLFILGEKYLKAQIDAVTQKAIVYSPKYYQIEKQLKELEYLLNKMSVSKINAFSYLSSPNYPIARDKPKKVFISSLGFIIGTFLGVFLVLFTHFRKNEEKKF